MMTTLQQQMLQYVYKMTSEKRRYFRVDDGQFTHRMCSSAVYIIPQVYSDGKAKKDITVYEVRSGCIKTSCAMDNERIYK